MSRLEDVIEIMRSIRYGESRAWIFDGCGNIRQDVICGDIIPFLEDLKAYEINVSDKYIYEFLKSETCHGGNTYNWNANICNDINFHWQKGCPIILAKVHISGDIRANYTDYFAVKMEDYYDDIPLTQWYEMESAIQSKTISDRYVADIYLFRETYDVYDYLQNETVGEFWEIEIPNLLQEINKVA